MEVTVAAVAVKVAVEAPEGTETLDWTGRAVALLLARVTGKALVAALFRVTVQVVDCPESTVAGEQASVLSTTGADKVSEKVRDPLLAAAVITAVSSVVTEAAVTVNAAVVAEAVTVTLAAASVALALLLDRATETPPAGAAAESVTEQLAVPGALTVAGVQVRVLTDGSGPTATAEVLLTPAAVADTVAD